MDIVAVHVGKRAAQEMHLSGYRIAHGGMDADEFAKGGETWIDVKIIFEHCTRSITGGRELLPRSSEKYETKKKTGVEKKNPFLLIGLTEEVKNEQHPGPVNEQIFVIIDLFPGQNNGDRSCEGEHKPELRPAKR